MESKQYIHIPTGRIATKVKKKGGLFEDYYYSVEVPHTPNERKTTYVAPWIVENGDDWEPKEPFFVTEDGVEIKEGENITYVNKRGKYILSQVILTRNLRDAWRQGRYKEYLAFFSVNAANNWIEDAKENEKIAKKIATYAWGKKVPVEAVELQRFIEDALNEKNG